MRPTPRASACRSSRSARPRTSRGLRPRPSPVEPEPSSARSTSSTSSTPASARWKAMLVPITPPPTITTEARSIGIGTLRNAESGGSRARGKYRVEARSSWLPRCLCALLSRPAAPAASAPGHRQIPVGVSNVNDQTFNERPLRLCHSLRARPRHQGPSGSSPGSHSKGTNRLGGRPHYAHGNGGRIWARLVQVDRRGRPDLDRVIASERVNPVKRYYQNALGLPHLSVPDRVPPLQHGRREAPGLGACTR